MGQQLQIKQVGFKFLPKNRNKNRKSLVVSAGSLEIAIVNQGALEEFQLYLYICIQAFSLYRS